MWAPSLAAQDRVIEANPSKEKQMFPIPELIANAEVDYRRELARSCVAPRRPARRRHLIRHRQPSIPEQRKGSALA